jgi:hypothetical protein
MSNHERYVTALHKIQTAVRLRLNRESVAYNGHDCCVPFDTSECSPKHLRTGVESAMASAEGLGRLLVDKGLVTRDELESALVDALEARADDRAKEIGAMFGPNVTIG